MENKNGKFPFGIRPSGDLLNGRKGRKFKKSMGILLAAVLMFHTLPSGWLTAAASEDSTVGRCEHHPEHTEDCGYVPASEDGKENQYQHSWHCAYECRICPIEELIAALPDKVTEDNAKKVRAQLDKILALYGKLTEEEQEQTDLSRCLELQEVLDVVNVSVTADVAAGDVVINSKSGQIITFTADQCGSSCQGHTITQNVSDGVAQNTTILVESGVHNITFSGLNLTTAKVGVMPGGTMNLTIDGTNSISASASMAGIYVPVGATMVITGQSTGSLNVSGGGGGGAGIGGGFYAPNSDTGNLNCGTVIINGGTITANGSSSGAGIGGASSGSGYGNGGTITINGGIVTAAGGSDDYWSGAGIGGGAYNRKSGYGGTLTIKGGHVTLTVGAHDITEGNAYGFGQGSAKQKPSGPCELILSDESYLTLVDGTTLDPNGTYRITSNPTADMITVPTDMHYTSADMSAEIAQKVTLSGKEICGQIFKIDMEGWNLSVTKKSDLEYTAVYTHAEKGSVSKLVIILPCLHGDGAALTHHEKVEADCTHTGILEYWDCSVCGKNFSDEDGQTEITDTEIPIAAHTLTHHEKVESDCTHTGVVEYWECSVCGKKFSDKDGQTEITDTEIPIAAHTLTHYEGKEADCTQAGNVEYWDCFVCGKKFSDPNGQTEISDADVEIPPKPHTLTHHAGIEAGCLTEGKIEYWSCSVCDKRFSDQDGTTEVTEVKLPAAGHHYGDWQSNGNGTHTRTCQTQGCDSAETGDCFGGTATYTEKAKCDVCGGGYGEVLKDTSAPTGEISIRTSKWNSFLNTITFGLFFKDTEEVTITAEDSESGVASVSYYLSDKGMSEEEVKALMTEWTDVNWDTVTFSINKDKSCVVYAKVTDQQGNMTYLSSDGLIFDGTSPSITGIADGETYCTPQTVIVTDENLASVTVNDEEKPLPAGEKTLSFSLDAESGIQRITATDKAGNTTVVTVTMGHRYGTEWKSDVENHWQECTCGEKSNIAAHTKDDGTVTKPPTENETGMKIYSCSVCGYKMSEEVMDKLPPSHTHEFGVDWKMDAEHHWHECSCGERSDSSAHIEDGGSVTKPATETETGIKTYQCEVCGYEMRTEELEKLPSASPFPSVSPTPTASPISPTPSASPVSPIPSVPPAPTASPISPFPSVPPTPSEAPTPSTPPVLPIPSEAPTPSSSPFPPVLPTPTTSPGLPIPSVSPTPPLPSASPNPTTSPIPSVSPTPPIHTHTHSYGTDWKSNGSSHWKECACGERSNLSAHIEDGGSVTKPATETETGIKTYKCQVCGYVIRTEKLEKLPSTSPFPSESPTPITPSPSPVSPTPPIHTHTHEFGTEWKSDGSSHWKECACGDRSNISAHIEDDGSVTKPATETETGIKTYKCQVCGYVIRTEKLEKLPSTSPFPPESPTPMTPPVLPTPSASPVSPTPSIHTHEFGTEWKSDNGSHWQECTCGEITNFAAHIEDGGSVTKPATETENGIRTYQCRVCGYVMRTEELEKLSQTPDDGSEHPSQNGEPPFIKGAEEKSGWDMIRAAEETAEDGKVINIDMNGSTIVPGDIFDRIKGRNITITFDMGNDVLWSVEGTSITREKSLDQTGGIDFSVKTGIHTIPEDLMNRVAGECSHLQFHLAHEGEFGFTALLSVNLGKENAGHTASLYYYKESTGELEWISAENIAKDGTVVFALFHASDYVIVAGGEPAEDAGMDDGHSDDTGTNKDTSVDKDAATDDDTGTNKDTGMDKDTGTDKDAATGKDTSMNKDKDSVPAMKEDDGKTMSDTDRRTVPWWAAILGILIAAGIIGMVVVGKKKKKDE